MHEVFEHTADLGLRIRAADLDELFAEAGRGLFSLIVEEPQSLRPQVSFDVDLESDTLEDLFFDWLAELLYLFDARRLVLCRFQVQVESTSLHAQVAGENLDPARHRFLREVKAITYHGLRIQQSGRDWLAEVIVDI